jgi:hypothetical protein
LIGPKSRLLKLWFLNASQFGMFGIEIPLKYNSHCYFFRQPFSFVTTEVVEATCQCLLAQAEEAERKGVAEFESEGMVIEEFGRCLKQIIEIAKKTNAGNTQSSES